MEFGLDDQRPARFLVASVSESAGRNFKIPTLKLPSFQIGHSGTSPRFNHGGTKEGSKTSPRHFRPNPHELGREVQRVAAFVGGVVLAGVSGAVQNIAKSRPGIARSSLPFHQSFAFPWQKHEAFTQKSRESEELAGNLIARGAEYERALDVRAAVQCYEEAVKLSPSNLVSLCMAAKQWSDLTFYHDVRSDRERQLVNLKALEYAERAIAEHPAHSGGYMSACISKGRLALFTDNRTKVRLAKEAQEAAARALELGPDNDLAHHLMGRWHYEMAKINVVVRTVVRVMYGTSLCTGTKEDALEAYRRAIKLAPHRLLHHVEAGRILTELGQADAAREALYTALKCEVEDINAWHTRIDAEMLLAQLDRRPWKQPCMVPPVARQSGGGTPASLSTAALLGIPDSVLVEGAVVEPAKESELPVAK